ncbi:MAG TPA: DUF998 domain-containing protein [Gemmatimonadales bacterium]|nr:DUF998 domain-containing protein [Gemmatimonadales bacterium]
MTAEPETTGDRRADDRWLLRCGALAGPLFIATVFIQDLTRPGFDPRVHLLSQLALGSWGWVQTLNFSLAGVLNLLYAVGLWRGEHRRSGTWAPLPIAAFGVLLIGVAVFPTDPGKGFPPGVATPAHPSVPGVIHALSALFLFGSLTAAIVMLSIVHAARRDRMWASYCVVSAVLVVTVFIYGMAHSSLTGPALQLAVLIGWSAPAFSALRFLCVESLASRFDLARS